jgi:hypothetical protein
MLVWNLRELESEPWEIHPAGYHFFAMTWQFGHAVAAAYVGDQYLLRRADGTTQHLPFKGDINMLRFSPNGDYVAALKQNVIDIRSLATLAPGSLISQTDILKEMMISNDGNWLLTVGQHRSNHPLTVRVWQANPSQVCWELTARPPRTSETRHQTSLQLQDCQGLSVPESVYWQSYVYVLND